MRLERAKDRVLAATHLRRPQRESLERLHQLMLNLDRDLGELTPTEVAAAFRDQHPLWTFDSGYPELTFALATGVGKTRLMGAMMAYLYLSRQSYRFLLLAPRRAILTKLENELRPDSPKYMFVDRSLIADPHVWHRGTIESFSANDVGEPFEDGPYVYVLSPQSFTGEDRRVFRTQEFASDSMYEFLKAAPDLVVFADEAHHLGAAETAVWTRAIGSLAPQVLIGMTATPRSGTGNNIAYSYDLQTCLREKLYTKDVRVIVRQRTDAEPMSDEDWDHFTLDYGLQRLARKEAALADYHGAQPFPGIQPVLLVCAPDTAHADEVGNWLIEHRGLAREQVLVTHSGRSKTEEEIERLVGIERPDSRVRVVVNVFELTEGWDVSNVYVVAPLRRMGTFQGAVQTMGRGLRLPAGKRVENDELDVLDVLCFGRQSLQEVLKDALSDFGEEDDDESYLDVQEAGGDEAPLEPRKPWPVTPLRDLTIGIPEASRVPVEPDLDFTVASMRRLSHRAATEFRLGRDEVAGTSDALAYDFALFVDLVTTRVLSDLRYLSEPMHRPKIEHLARGFLDGLGYGADEPVLLDWVLIADILKDEIDRPYRAKPTAFRLNGVSRQVGFAAYGAQVPVSFAEPSLDGRTVTWTPSLLRLPIGGWQRCVYDLAVFDSSQECKVAQILDRDSAVQWWVRNDPPRVKIATPIGNYEPDFVGCIHTAGGQTLYVMIEVKRSDYWTPVDSDARVKARAANAWCAALHDAGARPSWEHWVVLDADVSRAESLADLKTLRVN
jgi:superfamily II DNA or RNA helicase